MGYEINSVWTEYRKKEIEELNEIIDNEYYIEREISKKLDIKRRFEEELKDELNFFNFDNVIHVMKLYNWQWIDDIKTWTYKTPSRTDIIKQIKDLFKEGLYRFIEEGEKDYTVSTGGIVLNMGRNGDNVWVNIWFDIAHIDKPLKDTDDEE